MMELRKSGVMKCKQLSTPAECNPRKSGKAMKQSTQLENRIEELVPGAITTREIAFRSKVNFHLGPKYLRNSTTGYTRGNPFV